jgi:hypothetical protein
MIALKSLPNPTPVRSLVVCYFSRFTTATSKQQKNSNKSRWNCKFALSGGARQNAAWIGPENSTKVQYRIVFFPAH